MFLANLNLVFLFLKLTDQGTEKTKRKASKKLAQQENLTRSSKYIPAAGRKQHLQKA